MKISHCQHPAFVSAVMATLFAAPALASDFAPLQGEHYQLRVASRVSPVVINRIHAWELDLRDREGQPVTQAAITVRGGMPAHNHGLPTAPEVTQELAPGRYLLEGMKFQMGGEWEVNFQVDAEPGQETLTLRFSL
ncbi:MAG: FixH family protein [Oceanococcaceae bacterium]